jgi:hypothetical protein
LRVGNPASSVSDPQASQRGKTQSTHNPIRSINDGARSNPGFSI